MLCSEFAARTTAAAFIELNNKLKAELDVKEDMIKIPFTNRERFRTMHPDRLVKILSDAGCITEMERTDTEKKKQGKRKKGCEREWRAWKGVMVQYLS